MNLAAVYAHIAAAEQRFDVADLRLADTNVWLPARDLFVRPFFEYRLRTYKAVLRATSHTDPLSWELLRDRDLAFSPDVDYRHRDLGDLVLFNKHGAAYGERHDRPVDVLVYHAFTDYGEEVAGRAFNRVNDGVVELAPDRDRVVKLMRAGATAPLLPYHNPTHFYVELDRRWRDPAPVAGSDEETLMARVAEMVAWARDEGIPHVFEPRGFLERLRTLLWRAGCFQEVLRYFAPRSVFLSSYSNIERMAMIVACWREGVPAVDVEHGFMGPYSPYGRLGFVPPEGVRVLPRWFWCWGEENRAFVERSLGPGTPHGAVVGGSTWHRARQRLVTGGVLEEERPALLPAGYVQRLRAARRVVYFCWQPDMLVHDDPPSLLPPHFLDAAAASGDDVLFCIRLHPRSHHLIARFAALLARHGVRNWEIECSTRYPLLDILPLTDVLLTSYSTVAFEANELGIPVVLVDAFGADMMRDYVRRGVFHTATDAEALRSLCDGLDRAGVTRVGYASDDPGAHERAFAAILDAGPATEAAVGPAEHAQG